MRDFGIKGFHIMAAITLVDAKSPQLRALFGVSIDDPRIRGGMVTISVSDDNLNISVFTPNDSSNLTSSSPLTRYDVAQMIMGACSELLQRLRPEIYAPISRAASAEIREHYKYRLV